MSGELKPGLNRREHELKTWPEFYQALHTGEKTFELRVDDRGYRAGDVLHLREWNPRSETYSGREMRRLVTYIISGQWGLEKDVVCMALSAPSAAGKDAQEGCTRSHPHEDMSDDCELKTIEARQANRDAQDAARWRETLHHIGGNHSEAGLTQFTLRYLKPAPGANIMRGSVSEHFTDAIDAAIQEGSGKR